MDLSLVANIILWAVVAAVALVAASRSRFLLQEGAREGVLDFFRIIPRIFLGVVGSGYLAEIMPQNLVIQSLGPNSGLLGVTIASFAGALTPGGAVIGFALGATALKAGAGAPQVIAYTTAWALFALQRVVVWEIPMMPPRIVWLRAAVSVPLPFLAAFGAMLIGKP